MTGDRSYEIDATGTSLDVLECLVDAGDAVGVSEVATELGVSKSMVYNHLSTLLDRGYVVKRDRKYAPSLRLLSLGERTRSAVGVYETGRDVVDNLADATGEVVELFIMEEHYGVPVAIGTGARDWRPPYTCGERMPLHVNAAGKAIIASLSSDRVDDLLAEFRLTASTERTVTDREDLKAEIKRTRESGVAFSRGEQYEGVVSVAAPVDGAVSDRGAALAITGPADRLHGRYFEEDLVGQVVSTADEIQVALAE